MQKLKIQTEQLYKNCTELIDSVLTNKKKFNKIYESLNIVMFEDTYQHVVQIASNELVLRHQQISLYYRDNIIQCCTNGISYVNDVVYIPIFYDYSFYSICTEDELFQLSTVVDIKNIKISDINKLNHIKDYFDYKHLENNI